MFKELIKKYFLSYVVKHQFLNYRSVAVFQIGVVYDAMLSELFWNELITR